ncbi:uncharacterized protein LOC118647198 [Monomorium pharaonis]|uniref:uncharacterized protein LOC118647198 n=1 Tax=Monomorium pharaonis TaxID=307658 RepID=UPI001747D4D2|nr:uncharacterized protein LOC118647198 [Monomorium pharaonis]
METRRQTEAILAAGQFNLSRWAANVPELCLVEKSSDKLFYDRDGVSTLGILWSPPDDCFALRVVSTLNSGICTKRTVLSDVARFFDPLGWAAPVLVFGKIFIQDLWMAELSWDDPLPDHLRTAWTTFAETLPQLNQLRIPRHVDFLGPGSAVELHGFSDASRRAYAAAVYLRYANATGGFTVSLLVAKTKVAPVKQPSIPRLELCGTVLLARLVRATARALNMEEVPTYAWTDTTVALAWIRSHPTRWKPFVAHRVTEVQDLVPPARWIYVPADAATRGISPATLADLHLWWTGPPWLSRSEYSAPEPGHVDCGLEEEELRPRAMFVARPESRNDVLHRYSSFARLLRVSALCLRFLDNTRHSQDRRTGFLTAEELSSARRQWVRIAQAEDFSEEIARLRNKRQCPAGSPLLPLRPVLDSDGLLRVDAFSKRSSLSLRSTRSSSPKTATSHSFWCERPMRVCFTEDLS